jgi:hypothetical protein
MARSPNASSSDCSLMLERWARVEGRNRGPGL